MTATKTFAPRPRDIERRWYVVDADGAVLGRLASEVAKILRGKHKPIYAPHADTGDHVIVVNAKGVRLTGAKETSKIYYRHSGYPGGIRALDYARILAERPALAVEKAVKGMLPKNRLGRQMITKLKVYAGPDHPHSAQTPQPLALGAVPPWTGLPEPKPAPEPARKAEPATKAKPASRAKAAVKGKAASGGAAKARSATAKRGERAATRSTRSEKTAKADAPAAAKKPARARKRAEPQPKEGES